MPTDSPSAENAPSLGSQQRVAALDAVRGLAVLVLVLGELALPAVRAWFPSAFTQGIVAQLSGSVWHGVTAYDLAFPVLVCVTGAASVLSLKGRRRRGQSTRAIMQHTLLRSIGLFAIGLVCAGMILEPIGDVRLVGWFQRIAVCYLVVSGVILIAGPRWQFVLWVLLVGGYTALLAFVSVPENGAAYAFETNLAAYVDRRWLPGRTYFADWDPEGLLTTLPAIAVALGGGLLAHWLLSAARDRTNQMLLIALAGLALINASILWHPLVPLNRYLWTSSWVLLTVGCTSILIGGFGLLLDTQKLSWIAVPITVLGRNALVVVIAAYLLSKFEIAGALPLRLLGDAAPVVLPTLQLILQLAALYTIAIWLSRRRTFVRL